MSGLLAGVVIVAVAFIGFGLSQRGRPGGRCAGCQCGGERCERDEHRIIHKEPSNAGR